MNIILKLTLVFLAFALEFASASAPSNNLITDPNFDIATAVNWKFWYIGANSAF